MYIQYIVKCGAELPCWIAPSLNNIKKLNHKMFLILKFARGSIIITNQNKAKNKQL